MKASRYVGNWISGILLGCCLASLAVQPAAHAAGLRPVIASGGTTMYEGYRVLQTGGRVPDSGSTISNLTRGKPETLTAPASIPGTTTGAAYAFLFWDIDGHLFTHRRATFYAPAHAAAFFATAWYLQTGGSGGPGPTAVTTYGFSLITDRTLPGTPIASVAPSSAWTAPSASVSTTTSVTITAANPLDFLRWLAADATATGTQLAVGSGISTTAIAFYGPNPCQSIENEIAALSVADFPPPNPAKELQVAARALELQLRACEARHGG